MKQGIPIWIMLPVMIAIGLIIIIIAIIPSKQDTSTENTGAAATNYEVSAEPVREEAGKASIVIEESNSIEEQSANADVNTQIQEIIDLEEAIDVINETITGE